MEVIPDEILSLFFTISKSTVIEEAIRDFSLQTQRLGDPPFSDLFEAKSMFEFAYFHIAKSKKVFFAELHDDNLGMSAYDYVFVNRKFRRMSFYRDAMILITLFHEAAHIYKRITPLGYMTSPSPNTNLNIHGETLSQREDGWRFENILVPSIDSVLFMDTAIFLSDIKSWNQSLFKFTRSIKLLQEEGEAYGGACFQYRTNSAKENFKKRCPGYF